MTAHANTCICLYSAAISYRASVCFLFTNVVYFVGPLWGVQSSLSVQLGIDVSLMVSAREVAEAFL